MKKVTALESFPGAADALGHKVRQYEKGHSYEIPTNMADLFIAAKLVKPYEAPKPAAAPKAETKPTDQKPETPAK